MVKKDFIHAIDDFQLDENLKYIIKRKVDNAMKNNQKQEKKSYKGRKVAIFSACLVAVMGVTMSMSVMADNTSILDNLIAKIQQKDETNPTKDYAVKVTTETTTSTSDTQSTDNVTADDNSYEHCITPYVDSYYCDGETLYITYGIKANAEDLAQCNYMFGGMDIKINGVSLDNGEKSTKLFTANSDTLGLFIGKINVDVSNIENLQGAKVDIDFNVESAVDGINYEFDYDSLYYDNKTRIKDKYIDDVVSFGFNLSLTNPQIDTYEVNQTQGDVTLNSVTVSPTGTQIDIDIQGEYFMLVHDSTGKELSWDGENTHIYKYETPMINVTSVTVGLYPLEEKNKSVKTPAYSFEVPIERGFSLDMDNDSCYSNIDVKPVYNPPIEDIMPLLKEEALKNMSNADTIGTDSGDKFIFDDERSFKLTITDSQTANNFNGFVVNDDVDMSYAHVDTNGNIEDGYHAIIIEATLENLTDNALEFYKQFQISTSCIMSLGLGYPEPVAFENSDDKDYIITVNANETVTFKVGFVVSDDIDTYDMPLACIYGFANEAYTVRLK